MDKDWGHINIKQEQEWIDLFTQVAVLNLCRRYNYLPIGHCYLQNEKARQDIFRLLWL
jgi:hypothetical protein